MRLPIGLEDLWVLLTERRELKNVVYPIILEASDKVQLVA